MTMMQPVITFLLSQTTNKFTLVWVTAGANLPRRPVMRVLDKLTAEGYLEVVADDHIPNKRAENGPPRRNTCWRIIKPLAERPVVMPRRNTLRDKIWKIIRAKRFFSKLDLVGVTGSSRSTVDQYLRQLEQCGYIRKTGKEGRVCFYMLVKNQVQRPDFRRAS